MSIGGKMKPGLSPPVVDSDLITNEGRDQEA